MRFLIVFLFMFASLHGGELFPFKTETGFAPYRAWGKVVPVPAAERARRGDLEILDGGFTRNLNWNRNESGWLEISVRFRNVPEGGKQPGLEVTLNDATGFAGQLRGVVLPENGDFRCVARIPVAPDLKQISIWCHGAAGSATGVDQYIIRLLPPPRIMEIPQTPEIKAVETTQTPFAAEVRFDHYFNNSRGAAIERAGSDDAFREIGEALPGFHTFTDATVQPGKTYRYRVKNRSDGGESAWSKPVTVTIPAWKRSPGNTVYYIDSQNGDDANAGTTPETAWKSAARVNHTVFAPGDRLRFKRGSSWNTPLELRGSGTPGAPIMLDAYGDGELPQIAVTDQPFAVRLKNQNNWDIAELDLTNSQTIPADITVVTLGSVKLQRDDPFFAPYARKRRQTGLTVELENFGVAENIRIHHLNIHDVEGAQNAKENGGILVKIDGHRKPSRFHNLTIENNTIRRVCRSGIVFTVWPHARRTDWFPSTQVRISGNRLSDIGGDGIVPWACDGVQVTGNAVYRAAATAREANVAIWPWSCDNAVFSGNIAAHTAKHPGNGDGQGFDVDTNNLNTVMENNLSFHNGGGFILICGEEDTPNRGARIRNNVSIADGMSVFTLWNNVREIDIADNTIYAPDSSRAVYLIANWGKGDADPIQMEKIEFHNNLIVADTPLTLRGEQKSWLLQNNQYSGAFARQIAAFGRGNTIVDPKFTGSLNCNSDIPSQLAKLVPAGTGAGADIARLLKALRQNGLL